MIKCGTGCNPLVYKGYGCYCGFLGSGKTVDGIDRYSLCHVITSCLVFCCRCCKMHDWCYTTTSCMILQYNLPYFVPYKWKCNGGAPYCGQYLCLCYILTSINFSVAGKTPSSSGGSCSHQVGSCAICHLPHLMIHILTRAAV